MNQSIGASENLVLDQQNSQAESSPTKVDRVYSQIHVCGDWLASKRYPAYSDGTIWNGFACPHFTFDVAMQIALETPQLQYLQKDDVFVTVDEELKVDLEVDAFGPSTILVDGVAIKVYAIGAWSWTWGLSEQTECEKFNVKFAKTGGFWQSTIRGQVVITRKQEGSCRRNTEKFLTAHDGYYARLFK
jgi:hypothetical protein